jgi:hypothetical protein
LIYQDESTPERRGNRTRGSRPGKEVENGVAFS